MNKPKLRISTQKANITFFFEKEEEADHLFENLMSQVIGHSKKDFSNKPDQKKFMLSRGCKRICLFDVSRMRLCTRI